MTIDIEALRNDLMDYYGTASTYNPNATMDLIEVENASLEELVRMAESIGLDLSNYEVKGYTL